MGATGETTPPSAVVETPPLASTQCPVNVPPQGSSVGRSHRPLFGLHTVPLVHIAMQPPAARLAAAAPTAAAVMVAAPMAVSGLPVLQGPEASRARMAIVPSFMSAW